MREVQKVKLPVALGGGPLGEFAIMLPKDAEIIHFALHFGQPAFWIITDPSKQLDIGNDLCTFLVTQDKYALDQKWNVYHGTTFHHQHFWPMHLFQACTNNQDGGPVLKTYGGRRVKG